MTPNDQIQQNTFDRTQRTMQLLQAKLQFADGMAQFLDELAQICERPAENLAEAQLQRYLGPTARSARRLHTLYQKL